MLQLFDNTSNRWFSVDCRVLQDELEKSRHELEDLDNAVAQLRAVSATCGGLVSCFRNRSVLSDIAGQGVFQVISMPIAVKHTSGWNMIERCFFWTRQNRWKMMSKQFCFTLCPQVRGRGSIYQEADSDGVTQLIDSRTQDPKTRGSNTRQEHKN